MNRNVIITCAVTGAGDAWSRHPDLPVSTDQIAAAVLSAAEAGAAVAHIHVRDPQTGQGSRDVDLFSAVVEKVRASDTDVIINLTAGMGGSWFPSEDGDPSMPGPGTDMIGPAERLAHVDKVRPDICSLDCGTMNFGENETYISTPGYLTKMAELTQSWGVKPEMEVFDLGHVRLAYHGVQMPIQKACWLCVTHYHQVRTGRASGFREWKCQWLPRQCCSEGMYALVWKTIYI